MGAKIFEIKTRQLRGCNLFGQRPKHSIALWSDNCTMHSTDQAKRCYARKWSIYERDLIPNATHVQQPVDQHLGNYLQNYIARKYWEFGENLLDEVDAGKRDENDKVGAKEKRELLCKCANEAIEEARKQKELLRHSWTNFGLYLPLNGESDGDTNTLVR